MRRKTTKEFIKEAIKTHGDKYDYSKTKYVNAVTKVEIICPQHGSFIQRPNDHINGAGCPSCSGKKRRTTKDFILEAVKIHGDKYDYSLVEYRNKSAKVKIICPEHGVFEQAANVHLKGNGCKYCSGKKFTKEMFVKKAIEKHGDKYNYSNVIYVDNDTKVEIVCKEHGSWHTTPSNHLKGTGCPKCTKYGFNKNKPGILYYLKIVHEGTVLYKIGITNKSVKERFCKETASIEKRKNLFFRFSGFRRK